MRSMRDKLRDFFVNVPAQIKIEHHFCDLKKLCR